MMGKRLRPAMTSDKKIGSLIAIVLLVALYVFLFMLDNALPSNSTTVMLITVLKKGAIYALVCVSMNLLNGFTGLFSLGQAGFMLIGAYAFPFSPSRRSSTPRCISILMEARFSFPFRKCWGMSLAPMLETFWVRSSAL